MKKGLVLALILALCPMAAKAEESISLCAAALSPTPPEEFRNLKMMRAGSDGWLFAQRDLRRAPALDDASRTQLTRLIGHFAATHTRLVIALVPNRVLTAYSYLTPEITAAMPHDIAAIHASYMAKLNSLSALGAVAPDLLSAFDAHKQEEGASLFFKRDHHWTPLGSRIAATALAQALSNPPELTEIQPQSFTSAVATERQNTGSYTEYAQKACATTLTTEPYDYYRTKRSDGVGLLDDPQQPDIALAGTSFSSDRFNFAGFLAEALNRDVLNVSVDGGGIDNSLATYLSSAAYAQHRPRVLIWEVPAHYMFDVPLMWRQVVPAAGPACTDTTALTTSSVTLAGETKLLGDFDLKVTPGQDFLYLESSDAGLVKFNLRLVYSDGKNENVALNRSTRADNSGAYYLELSKTHTANLRSVTLIPSGTSQGTVTARICPGMP